MSITADLVNTLPGRVPVRMEERALSGLEWIGEREGLLSVGVPSIAPLTAADETLTHQAVNTFASVVESDRSWTEKLWCAMGAKDGSFAVDFGIGKYHNRNVIDGFAGISCGLEHWIVRASRELSHDFASIEVGPLHCDIVEPLHRIRFVLDENDVQPISFDLEFEGLIRPFFEERHNYLGHLRTVSDVVRYHQSGSVSGWVKINGERHDASDWLATRDHSWGIRSNVGVEPTDLQPGADPARLTGMRTMAHWSPLVFTKPDGSRYEVMQYLLDYPAAPFFSGHYNYPDGRQEKILKSIVKDPTFYPDSRRLRSTKFEFLMENGETREISVEAIADSGFYLGLGGYSGWKQTQHGSWKGELHLDGDYIPNAAEEKALMQGRDTLSIAYEGDAVGYGIHESGFRGDWPEFGLTAETDLIDENALNDNDSDT